MGLLSFIKEAGEKLFGGAEAKAAQVTNTTPAPEKNVAALSKTAAEAIKTYITSMNLTSAWTPQRQRSRSLA